MGRHKKEKVEETVEQIEIVAGQIEQGTAQEDTDEILEFTSYGADVFDLIAGGGAPFGKVVNLIGDNSVGKSFIASEIVAAARKKYGKDVDWYYDDAEAGYSFNSRAIWNFDIITEDMEPSETIEEFALHIDKCLDKIKPGKKFIYILDSFDALSSMAELEEFENKMEAVENGKAVAGSYGQGKSKGTNQFFRVLVNKIKNKDCLLVIISQVRENIGASKWEPKYRRNGGKSLDLYACQIFWLAVAEKYTKKDTVIGVGVNIKNSKNKAGKPYREGYIDIIFDFGLDNVSSNIKYLYDLKTDGGKDTKGKKKEVLEWDGTGYDLPGLIQYIEDNNLERELSRRVYAKWNDFEQSLVSSERKRRY